MNFVPFSVRIRTRIYSGYRMYKSMNLHGRNLKWFRVRNRHTCAVRCKRIKRCRGELTNLSIFCILRTVNPLNLTTPLSCFVWFPGMKPNWPDAQWVGDTPTASKTEAKWQPSLVAVYCQHSKRVSPLTICCYKWAFVCVYRTMTT